MKTDTLEATVLPELGGKIASLRRKGVELFQAPLRPYAPRSAEMGFEESDASGFDECLPSVSACEIAGKTGAIRIPDHGEVWRLRCEAEQSGKDEIRLTVISTVLPLRLVRRLRLNKDTLRMDYRLRNEGEIELPYLWSAHPLCAVDEGDIVVLPESITRVAVESSARQRLGRRGDRLDWRIANGIDLSRAGQQSDGTADKLYADAPYEGWAAIERKKYGLKVQVEFDPTRTPFLGLWLCYGGWPERQLKRQHCVALEPCTAPTDSLADAITRGWARNLAPGQTDSWWMSITIGTPADCKEAVHTCLT